MERDTELILTCPFCGKEHTVEVNFIDYAIHYKEEGGLAQEVFPYLNATEREQIISHICPECQEEMFGSEDDYVDDDVDETNYDPYLGCDFYETFDSDW